MVEAAPAAQGVDLEEPTPIAPNCAGYCNSSCCYFSNPPKSCSGCTAEVECRPGAACYETGWVQKAEPTELPANCREWCRVPKHCCSFSDPVKDCSGCNNASFGCNPTAKCYPLGRNTETTHLEL